MASKGRRERRRAPKPVSGTRQSAFLPSGHVFRLLVRVDALREPDQSWIAPNACDRWAQGVSLASGSGEGRTTRPGGWQGKRGTLPPPRWTARAGRVPCHPAWPRPPSCTVTGSRKWVLPPHAANLRMDEDGAGTPPEIRVKRKRVERASTALRQIARVSSRAALDGAIGC